MLALLIIFGRISLGSHLFLDFCLLGGCLFVCLFFNTNSISYWSVQFVSFFLIQSLSTLCFSDFYPFLLGCSVCWPITVCNILWQYCVSLILVVVFSFLSYFAYVDSLFFLMSLAKSLSILFILLKTHLLLPLIFSIFYLYFIHFLSDLYYFSIKINKNIILNNALIISLLVLTWALFFL